MGRLLDSKLANREPFKNMMIQLWKPEAGLQITVIWENLFLFRFNNLKEKKRVIRNEPWGFNRTLLVLDEVDGRIQLSAVKPDKMNKWV